MNEGPHDIEPEVIPVEGLLLEKVEVNYGAMKHESGQIQEMVRIAVIGNDAVTGEPVMGFTIFTTLEGAVALNNTLAETLVHIFTHWREP